jgi:cytochrome c biogenesis protein
MEASSSTRKDNPVWNFFSSVRLAVFLLIALAATSVVGTLLPQGESLQFYLERYGPGFFQAIRLLHLHDTYHSWWFVTLLCVFSLNLTVCTMRRLPFTLKLYQRDSLAIGAERLAKMPLKSRWEVKGNVDTRTLEAAVSTFQQKAGKSREKNGVDGGRLFLVERGKWSYWGLYGLHSSILVIFLGALVGLFLGFKGSVMLPEGESTDHVVDMKTGLHMPFGFSVRCDKFSVDFYETGAPKEFRSDLTVLDDGKEVLKKAILVNDPLHYQGITFYQASYQATPEMILTVAAADGSQRTLGVAAYQKTTWAETDMAFWVSEYRPDIHGGAARIWIVDNKEPAQDIWLLREKEREFSRGGNLYRIRLDEARQRYMTGLQVKKDPGVWIVWLGCTTLIIGFVIVFWVAHRRMWLWIGTQKGKNVILLSGQTNKNRLHFEKDFAEVEEAINRSLGDRT